MAGRGLVHQGSQSSLGWVLRAGQGGQGRNEGLPRPAPGDQRGDKTSADRR